MIIIMKRNAPDDSLDLIKEYLISNNFDIHQSTGANRTIIGVIGNTTSLNDSTLSNFPSVHQIVRIIPEE